ncbi:hypothetical protein GOV03_01925 [Candidatus Woesearchaeota archaeon]|nr:hypothetical protein [Candidatus Woesearchaeota archaeon]
MTIVTIENFDGDRGYVEGDHLCRLQAIELEGALYLIDGPKNGVVYRVLNDHVATHTATAVEVRDSDLIRRLEKEDMKRVDLKSDNLLLR